MGTWGILALVVVVVVVYLLVVHLWSDNFLDDDGRWMVAADDDRKTSPEVDDGIAWHPDCVFPREKGRYWTKHPEAPNHVFEGTRWNGNMWISEDGHPCYFQQREWAYPVEQAAA